MERESHGRFTLVRPRVTDFDIQGILNSKQYLDLVTEARIEQMARYYKLPMEIYVQRNQSWVISRFVIEYKKPIPFLVSFFIHTKVKSVEGPKAVVEFTFLSLDKGKTFAEGEVHYHLLDLSTRKSVPIPEHEREVYLENAASC